MILDRIENLKLYTQIPYIKDIVKFIKERDSKALLVGEIPIKGRDLFVRVAEYETQPALTRRFESHRVYADVQYIVSGVECMGFSTENNLSPLTEYDEKEDIQFFESPKCFSPLIVSQKEFVVFLPHELHQPGCIYQKPSLVKKLVFKVRI